MFVKQPAAKAFSSFVTIDWKRTSPDDFYLSELESSLHKIESETKVFSQGQLINRSTSRFDARLEFKQNQKPYFLISNAR